MRKVCAWCKKEMAGSEQYSADGDITHGICSLCSLEFSRNIPKTAQQILDMITEPIFLLDNEGIVKSANSSGRKLIGKEYGQIRDHLSGDVLECAYAALPEGCGQTEHCMTCAIRNTVMDTLATGKSYTKVPAFQSINTPDGVKIMRFYVSTEKLDEHILLRIDEVTQKATI
jgi:hypothetical protein